MENRKVFLNKHTNLLELEEHMYLMTGLYLIICRMKYGSQTQHSEMVSSRELHIRLNRLFRFMNICTDSAARKEKYGRANSFYTVKKTEMLSIAAWKKGMNFRRLRVGSEQAKKILSL